MRRFAAIAPGIILALALGLAACKPAKPPLDESAEMIARSFFEEVRNGDDIMADPHVARELKNPTSLQQIAEFRAMIPSGLPSRVEVEDYDVKTDDTGTTTRMSVAYRYAATTILAQTALFKAPSGHEPVIVGFKITPQPLGS